MSDSPYPPLFRSFGIKDLGVVPARSLGLKDLLVTSLRTNDLVRDPSLRSGFRQRAPASLTPAKRLNLTFQRALKMGLGQLRGPSCGLGRNCPNQISIVTRYGSYVNGF